MSDAAKSLGKPDASRAVAEVIAGLIASRADEGIESLNDRIIEALAGRVSR